MKKKLAISIIIFTVMAVLTACSAGKTETAGQKEAAGQEEDAGQKESTGQEEDSGQQEVVEQKGADSAASAISFETTDLDGNVVKSADLFKGHRLTMVNIWGTFCGPCIDEMPELEKLNYRLKQKDCAIVGIVCDVESPEDSETIGAAKSLIDEIGV
ncbi:MAG: TlpA disulfide reductase family protein, partial [Eubacteriales bacterium]|nr:TlpA disulfide reductase family protein [Eubacteriales bacterium]